jgi:pentatricopeptide repeat protein
MQAYPVQLHPNLQILPNLKSFSKSPAAFHHNAPRNQRLAPSRTPASNSGRIHAASSPSKELAISGGSSGYMQDQLNKAVRFQDLEACIYLLKNQSSQDQRTLVLSKPQLRALVSCAFHHHRPDQAIDLVVALPTRDPRNFSVLMKECLQRRDISALDKVLHAREASGFQPDAYSVNAKITALGTSGQSAAALEALRQAWNMPHCRRVEVINAAIGACAVAGDWAGAESSFELLKSAGLSPDSVTYNGLIKAAGNARLMTKVKQLFDEMVDTEHLKPTHQTYTGLFSAAAKNRCTDSTWLFKIFNDMALAPNDYVLSSFFSAVACAPCTRAQLDTVFTALAEARSRGSLNDTVYTALLKLVTRQNIADRAVDVWRAAQQDSVALSPHIFSALFAACAAGQSPALVDVALDAYEELRDWWGAQDKHRMASWMERDVQWAYNSLINFIAAEEGRLDEALAVFESMKREGPLPDTVTFNTVMAAAGRAQDPQRALDLFCEVSNFDLQPTERTFGALLHAFATVGDANGAASVLRSLSTAGIQPNAVMYTSFIDALVTSGEQSSLENAFKIVEEMKSKGVGPTAVTYGCLLNACDKLGDVSRAFQVYQEACDEGVPPSDQMHDILIGVCTRGGRLDEALDLVKRMARTHANLQQHTLDSLVRALSGTSPWRALRMLSLMQAKGMAPSHATYLALVGSCARASDGADALALYHSMRAQGMEVDGSAGSALITCLCQSQDLQQAVAVYDEMMVAAWRRGPASIQRGQQQQQHQLMQQQQQRLAAAGAGYNNNNRSGNNNRHLRKGGLPKRAHVPDAAALASLAQAFAALGEVRESWKFYKQLRRGAVGMEDACLTHRRMFEALIEQNCRSQNVERALIVFDDWKAASAAWFARRKEVEPAAAAAAAAADDESTSGSIPSTAQITLQQTVSSSTSSSKKVPKLSNVSLAFLEACCRSEPGLEWRVYDVCSVMRMQKERKLQEGLARPQKASHHVLGSIQMP